MAEKYKVMIVDDQMVSRMLFENFVRNSDKYELAASLDDADLADIYMAKYDIDLVIMDVVMHDRVDGISAAEKIKKSYPRVKIIIVTSMPEVSLLDRARAAGADSFWYKEVKDVDMLSVMDRTMAGEHVYPLKVPVLKLGQINSDELTKSELMVLRELTTGAENNEISEKLNISVNTVRAHISHMLEKTGFSNRTELAIEARMKGVVIAERE